MKDIKLNMNREELTSSEIEQGKNFQKILDGAKSTPPSSGGESIFKSTLFKTIVGAVVATVVVVTVYMNYEQSMDVAPFIDPPLMAANVQATNYTVDATQGGEIITDRGTVITIPPGAFVDKDGNPIDGNFTIDYREMHDPVEIALSGIPMHYDSAGTHYTFESAGMLDIRGFQNGKPIFIRDGEMLNIDLASFDNGEDFNLYYLDTTGQKWDYVQTSPVNSRDDMAIDISDLAETGGDMSKRMSEMAESDPEKFNFLSKMGKEMKKVEKRKPVKPRMSTKENFRLTLDVDAKEFPEIAIYKDLQFEVSPQNKKFNPKMLEITWDHIDIRKGKGNSYVLDVRKLNRKESLIVYPVVSEEDYDASIKLFEDKLIEYKKVKERLLATQEAKKAEFAAARADYNEKMQALVADRQKRMEKMLRVSIARWQVQRSFGIAQFGTWNCDRPTRPPVGLWMIASFTDKQGSKLNFKYVYLVELERNSVFRIRKIEFSNLRFNPRKRNVLWGITPEGKVAVFRAIDFAQLPKNNGAKYTFQMDVSAETITTLQQAKDFLNS